MLSIKKHPTKAGEESPQGPFAKLACTLSLLGAFVTGCANNQKGTEESGAQYPLNSKVEQDLKEELATLKAEEKKAAKGIPGDRPHCVDPSQLRIKMIEGILEYNKKPMKDD